MSSNKMEKQKYKMTDEHKRKIGDAKNNSIRNLSAICSYCHFAIHDNGKNTRFGGLK